MPPPETSGLNKRAVLWAASGFGSEGVKTAAPVEIPVRWEKSRRVVMGPDGAPVALAAEVVADRTIPPDSIMWLGKLADWYGSGSAGQDTELHQVKTYDEVDDVKGRVAMRVLGLVRYRNTLPEGS